MPFRLLRPLIALALALGMNSCSYLDLRPDRSAPSEFMKAQEDPKPVRPPQSTRFQPPAAVSDALLPDLSAPGESAPRHGRERRFDVSVMQVDAREFFMGLVADSEQNVVVHPDLKGAVTIDLKNVTLPEVLEAVREVYGYDYKKTGAGYLIFPSELMSRIYHVDYINFVRNGRSETRVSSGPSSQSFYANAALQGGALGQNYGQGAYGGGQAGYSGGQGGSGSGGASQEYEESIDCRNFAKNSENRDDSHNQAIAVPSRGVPSLPGSVVSTTSSSQFWRELKQALGVIVCDAADANFVVNQQSGVVVVRAYPRQLREVEQFLEAMRREVERQVVLEAKILEVELKDGYQAGVDWASVIRDGQNSMLTSLTGPIGPLSALATQTLNVGQAFTVSVNMGDFKAFIELLETQGNVNTLSSPRISTLNNQKAVIKVGKDELHVSNVNPGSFANTIGAGGFSPSPVLSPFFSGISLDVTPQIDDKGMVTLHVHPAVTQVSDQVTRLNFGDGEQEIPLALSQVRESDSVVHAQTGQIVVIGGLMQNTEQNSREGIAWLSRLPWVGSLFRRGTGTFVKSELVILLKPTVIQSAADWKPLRDEMAERYRRLDGESRRDPLP